MQLYSNLSATRTKSNIAKFKQPGGTFVSEKIIEDDASRTMPSCMSKSRQNLDKLYETPFLKRISIKDTKIISSLVLLVEFNDIKFSNNAFEKIQNMINGESYSYNGATGSVKKYFNDNFKGYAQFDFIISDILSLNNNESFYGDITPTSNDINPEQMVYDACLMASQSGIDFSEYDLDLDGKVDNVHILFAGYNQAEGGEPSTIWPHNGDISNMKLVCNGVTIGKYSCTSEFRDSSGEIISPIGTFCHEYLHSLGLIDMYDTNAEIEGLSHGLWKNLSIMDKGIYLNNGNTPPFFTAIEREILGIGEIVDISSHNTYTIESNIETGKIFRIKTLNPNEYFLLECRSGKVWDKYVGGKGLIIYHVDKSKLIYGGIESEKRWIYNNVNSFREHECARVVPASLPESEDNIANIFYPGPLNIRNLCSENDLLLKDWSSNSVGLEIRDICYLNERITFNTTPIVVYDDKLPKASKYKFTSYQCDCIVKWQYSNSYIKPDGWILKWKLESDEDYTNQVIVNGDNYHINNLLPGNNYILEFSCFSGNFLGESVSVMFKTLPITSKYPYINIKGEYNVNDTIELRIYNLSEPYKEIIWRVNSAEILTTNYSFTEKTTYIIEAEIIYLDNTTEIIKKSVVIK